jgi:CobQ-like glutamine amidotransferase family enzyme
VSDEQAPFRIVQLYPEQLGVTGDRGNAMALRVRLERAGIAAEHVVVRPGDDMPGDADILLIGNGPLSAMRQVAADLERLRPAIEAHHAAGRPLLAVGGGAELLCRGVVTLDGANVRGLGLFPFRASRTRERKVGYLIAESEHGPLIGFEDHASVWSLDEGVRPYARVKAGRGSTADRGETVRVGDAYATNVQGPVLPLNPQLTDAILRAATAQRGIEYTTGGGHERLDALARGARDTIVRLVDAKTFKYIGV